MKITRISMFTGKERTIEFPTVTQERLDEWVKSTQLIQDVFPELTNDQREFLMTGVTSEEWDEEFLNEGC